MTRRTRQLGVFVIGLALLGAGCRPGKYTGGGWLPSAVESKGKATFGFNLHAYDLDGDGRTDSWKGQFQYNDHAAGVKFHGTPTDGGWPETYPPFVGYFIGVYEPRPGNVGPGGEFDAYIYDFDQDGEFNDGDYIDILVYSGVYANYANSGYLGGGNIKSHTK